VRILRTRAHRAPETSSSAPEPGVRAFLYDATGVDRELPLDDVDLEALDESDLLWIDVSDLGQVPQLAAILGLEPETVAALGRTPRVPDASFHTAYFHLALVVPARTDPGYAAAPFHCIAGENWVATAHSGPLGFLNRFHERINGDSGLGRLDATGLLAVFLNEHIASYLGELEPLEHEVEQLDLTVMNGRATDDAVLRRLVSIRRRLAQLRRLLAPHRDVYSRLALPDFALLSGARSPEAFESLAGRSESALQILEGTRETIVSSFDVYTTWTAHETNKVMRLLTVTSVMLLPPTLLASAMGMNSLPDGLSGIRSFELTLVGMALAAAGVLGLARRREWI
jgi:magnesium transporter